MPETKPSWGRHVLWAVTSAEFMHQAKETMEGGAFCVFLIDNTVNEEAKGGCAALVIAYARAHEPVTILPDGAAVLLLKDGGAAAGHVVALRVLERAGRLHLKENLRVGIADIGSDPKADMEKAVKAAHRAKAGDIEVVEPEG